MDTRFSNDSSLLQEKARIRMVKQKDSDKTQTYWDDLWGKRKEYASTGKKESGNCIALWGCLFYLLTVARSLIWSIYLQFPSLTYMWSIQHVCQATNMHW